MENEAYTQAYHMAWVFFPCFLLIAMLSQFLGLAAPPASMLMPAVVSALMSGAVGCGAAGALRAARAAAGVTCLDETRLSFPFAPLPPPLGVVDLLQPFLLSPLPAGPPPPFETQLLQDPPGPFH